MRQPQVNIQSKEKRVKNFDEVSLGYPKKLALEEARRCPQCSDPVCMPGCPLGINIPKFIRYLRESEISKDLVTIREHNSLPAVCGRICPAPCEQACIFEEEKAPIGVRALERYASDYGRKRYALLRPFKRKGEKIAVIGSGPAGLAAAAELAKMDYQVTIFESLSQAGGVLRYGIPEFRLPRKALESEIDYIVSLGVEIKTDVFIGQTKTLDEIFKEGFFAVLLAVGAGLPRYSDIPGTHFAGVFYADEFLMRINLLKAHCYPKCSTPLNIGEKIAVVGSGHSALDCARICARLNKETKLIFTGTEEDMHVLKQEKDYAKEENIKFEVLTKPLEILGDENHFVHALKCCELDYADSADSEGWRLAVVPDSEFVIDADTVILAIGHQANSTLGKMVPELKFNRDGTVKVNTKGTTSLKNVFACGNVLTGAGLVVDAMASGKEAAQLIDQAVRK